MKPNLCWTHWRKNGVLFVYGAGYIYAELFAEMVGNYVACDLCLIEVGAKVRLPV